ncbi:acyl-CoA dehydrogenase family protein [Bordetella muralis]|uniref:acyl-CoA dehydrogenase family protein n=1 Tax=Bordetella muralis TaxID=1649130 RepID=UPI0039F0D649
MDDIQSMLQDSANALFNDMVTAVALERAESGEFQQELWNAVVSQGFTLAMCSEQRGGSAMSWAQVYPLLHAAGRYALPVPLAETLLANYLLETAGCAETDGEMVMTIASVPVDAIKPLHNTTTITASLTDIPFAHQAQRIVLNTEIQGVPYIGWIDMSNTPGSNTSAPLTQTELNIAREPRDTLQLQNLPIQEWRAAPCLGRAATMRYGAMLRAAQMAGAIERILDQTVNYASERIQFGRPLAKFQAIQHHIAELGCEAAAVASAAAYAFERADHGTADLAIAAAKIRAGRAAGKAASLAHAVHGAIGFTYEHSLQYATRRLWSWRSEFGSQGWWALRLGQAICAATPESWWPIATSDEFALNL